MLNPLERENEIISVLEALKGLGLDFILVGGYAVSAYRHRFSIGADVVIRKGDKPRFEEMLRSRGYKRMIGKQLDDAYSSEYVRYGKNEPKADVDLLIGGIAIRQTGAAYSFELLMENSKEMTIEVSEKSVNARVPRREMLIALKLHSGRLTDLRDVAALAFKLDFALIKKILFRGNAEVLERNMKQLGALINKEGFRDSFKGVFMEKGYRIDAGEIRRLSMMKIDG